MIYKNILPGIFLARPNRFIAHVDVGGRTEVCHVKNTGRCRELLLPGATVWLEESANPARKTRFDLIAVEKARESGPLLINMDAQAPNKVFGEWAETGGLGFAPPFCGRRRSMAIPGSTSTGSWGRSAGASGR